MTLVQVDNDRDASDLIPADLRGFEAVSMCFGMAMSLLDFDRVLVRKPIARALKRWRTEKQKPPRRKYYSRSIREERNQPLWPSAILLQRILMEEITAEEEKQENECRAGVRALSENLMILRYIKQLLLAGANVFGTVVALTEILRTYSHRELNSIHQVTMQTDEAHEIATILSRRRTIIHSLIDRFDGFISLDHSARRNETRLLMRSGIDEERPVVYEVLSKVLHPWRTSCQWRFKYGANTQTDSLPELAGTRAEADGKLYILGNCLHAIVCHRCLQWITARLKVASPASLIQLPIFAMCSGQAPKANGGGQHSLIYAPDENDRVDFAEILEEITQFEKRARQLRPRRLRVSTDNGLFTDLDLEESSSVSFVIDREAKSLKISAHDGEGELLLVDRYIRSIWYGESLTVAYELSKRKTVNINIQPEFDSEGEPVKAKVSVEYHGPFLSSRLLLGGRQIWSKLRDPQLKISSGTSSWQSSRAHISKARLGLLIVVALIIIGIAGILYTLNNKRPAPMEAKKPAVEVPSPGLPERTQNETAIKFELHDAGGSVGLDNQNNLISSAPLPAPYQDIVRETLISEVVRVTRPPGLIGKPIEVMGADSNTASFFLASPLGKVINTARPTFRWNELTRATSYSISVFDSDYNLVIPRVSVPGTETTWKAPRSLSRGETYIWKVTALKDGAEIPGRTKHRTEAKFHILAKEKADELDRVRTQRPSSHLLIGVLYARAGLAVEARREFKLLAQANPGSPVAKRLLERLQ